MDGSIIISYFGGSNNIFADCTYSFSFEYIKYFAVIKVTVTDLIHFNANKIHHNEEVTRTKTSIRYAKENDREKRERRRERERKVEGEI